jgi:hypothetical protein
VLAMTLMLSTMLSTVAAAAMVPLRSLCPQA